MGTKLSLERLKELRRQIVGVHNGINGDDFRLLYNLLPLVDEAIVRQSMTDKGEISDGYHTFNELYEHRTALFATLCNIRPDISWKSMKHSDGTMYDNMFIAGIETPDGQYTYHCEMKYWHMFARTKEIEKAPKYDGHKPSDYPRLLALSENSLYRQSIKSEEVLEAIKELTYGSWQSSKDGYPITLGDKTIDLAVTAVQEYQPWISVKDRLPNDWIPVLVTYVGCNDGKPYSDGVARWRVKENAYVSGWLWDLDRSEVAVEITHWKPLPQPPKGE